MLLPGIDSSGLGGCQLFLNKCACPLFSAGEFQARPGSVDGANFEVHQSTCQADLSYVRLGNVRFQSRRLFGPRDPETVTCVNRIGHSIDPTFQIA